jgi:dihydrofolate synthase/folylpolyglutamate synthase
VSVRLQHALETLYGLERRKDRLGLEGTRALLGALGNPERRFRAVHVAGTNGKGTACALIERVLRAAGVRTGLFTSPHLVDFRERIRVGGRWADEARLGSRLEHIESLPEGKGRTFFEVCTALAFDDFAARGVEWAVVEVGLGGRLDCTNVLAPEVCAITGVGLDHTEILGDTIARIAAEKAGILKPGVPWVAGAGMDPEARAVIAREARAHGCPEVEAPRVEIAACAPSPATRGTGEDGSAGTGSAAEAAGGEHAPGAGARARTLVARIEASPWGPLALEAPGLRAAYQAGNLALALGVLGALRERGVKIPVEAVVRGVREARWPGRFEPCPAEPRLWWDAAHNPQGAAALADAWRAAALPAPRAIVVAVSADKDVPAMLAPLARMAGGALLVATRSRSGRALDPDRVAAAAAAAGFEARVEPGVERACRVALSHAGPGLALLAGSLFAVGEAMEAFGGAPGEWL